MDGSPVSAPQGLLLDALRRGNIMSPDCPSRGVLDHLTSRWGVLVLVALEGGTLRFSALRRLIGGVSERMLAQTLRQLEQDGLVQRRALDVVPPHVEYSLTQMGREAAGLMRVLTDWIELNISDIVNHRTEHGTGT